MPSGTGGGWLLVLVTASNPGEAEKIASVIVEDRLAACVNIVGPVKSVYWWKGRVESSSETLLIIKTRMDVFGKLAVKIRDLHSYEVPEIIAVPIVAGLPEYLKWIEESATG